MTTTDSQSFAAIADGQLKTGQAAAARLVGAALDQLAFAHHPEHPRLRFTARPSLRCTQAVTIR
jgi:hypothetical protein